MGRTAWGKAKREVKALKADILASLGSGATLEEIYKALSSAGRLTVGKSTFFRHAATIRDEADSGVDPIKPPTIELTPQLLNWLRQGSELTGQTAPSVGLSPAPHLDQAMKTPAEPAPIRRAGDSASSPLTAPAGETLRRPIGAGAEPSIRKFNFKPGEKDHWATEKTESNDQTNQGEDKK